MIETPNNTRNNSRPWLIAAWPGMGNVSIIAAGYLVHRLGMKPVAEIPPRAYFEAQSVDVKDGLIAAPRLPRSVFYRWVNPATEQPFLVFLGEAQPSKDSLAFAHELLDKAVELGAERIVTFASMASRIHPAKDPRVLGAATSTESRADLKRLEVPSLEDGQIGGLNGVLLGAAAERGLQGLCLLGEIPNFAVGVPNPKSARAILSVFSVLAGIDVSLDELSRYGKTVDKALIDLLARLREEAREAGEDAPPLPDEPEDDPEEEEYPTPAPGGEQSVEGPRKNTLELSTHNRIEQHFEAARTDRGRAAHLKEELDQLGVFEQYEDRFLDLFKRAG